MKIDKTFKIKEKYFNAILRFEKPFELRHEQVEPNSIIKLECENGRYLIFRTGICSSLTYTTSNYPFWKYYLTSNPYLRILDAYIYPVFKEYSAYYTCGDNNIEVIFNWYDTFCWEYINKAPTYLIEIAEILEVK